MSDPANSDAAQRAVRLSAIIITRNEAANIGDCLDSVAFCDERIVVDCGSDDDTVRIAGEKGARVVFHAWQGYGPQKNFALSLAQGEWVFSIDADERASPALACAIDAAIGRGGADGYEILRLTTFCGKVMRRPPWNRDYILRLFRRGQSRFSDDLVHERIVCPGTVERIREPLLHHSVGRLEDALRRMDGYSTLSAQEIVAAGRSVWFVTGIARGSFAFLRAYVLQLGFLNGAIGFLHAVAVAEGTYYRYMKAWLARRNSV